MGLAASQGRLLLLTARKSDLEFRAQQISQKRLLLSQQLESISRDYEEATSNRQMLITLYPTTSSSSGDSKDINLTYNNLISGTVTTLDPSDSGIKPSEEIGTSEYERTSNTAYRLQDVYGAIVV